MKFFSIIVAIALITAMHASAQLPHGGLYVHALYASPLAKSSRNLYNAGVGGTAGILAGKKITRFNASVGYLYFFADKNTNILDNETYIPFKAGIRQYLPLTLHTLFIQANAGVGFLSNEINKNSDTHFAFDFGAGIKLTSFEAAVIWENFKEKDPSGLSSWITVQAGFNIGL